MNRHDYTERPAVSEGRTGHDYGDTRPADDPRERLRTPPLWFSAALLAAGLGAAAVVAAVAGGWAS